MRVAIIFLLLLGVLWQPALALDLDLPVSADQSNEVVDLNLASSLECVPAALLVKSKKSYLITEGASQRAVNRQSMLTASEYFALRDLVEGRVQSLVICESGVALSGTIVLDSSLTKICRGLLVPAGIEVTQDTQKTSKVCIDGEFRLDGTYLITGATAGQIEIKARWITLQPSRLCTSSQSAPTKIRLIAKEELVTAGQILANDEVAMSAPRITCRISKPVKACNQLRMIEVDNSVVPAVLSGDVTGPAIARSCYDIEGVAVNLVPMNNEEQLIDEKDDQPVQTSLQQSDRKT